MSKKGISIHIGINSVDPLHYDGWAGELYGCENDAIAYETIAKKAGFSTKSFFTSKATSSRILNFLEKQTYNLSTGDILFISYSGHGGSIPNRKKDDGGHDETWCLYDRQLIDDELFDVFKKFKPGVRILVFSDSCHSGTVTREFLEGFNIDEFQRSFGKHTFIHRKLPNEKMEPVFKKNETTYKGILAKPFTEKNEISAFVVLFAACQDDETAKEYGENGIFTASFCQVFSNPIKNYNDLHLQLKKSILKSVQNPNLYTYGNKNYDFLNNKPFEINILK